MRLFGTMKINEQKQLDIGGCDTVQLAQRYGTPLYVMDEALIRSNCRQFKDSFLLKGLDTEVIYASKAFLNIAICKVVQEEGLGLFLLIDRLVPGWQKRFLKPAFPSPFAVLRAAVSGRRPRRSATT